MVDRADIQEVKAREGCFRCHFEIMDPSDERAAQELKRRGSGSGHCYCIVFERVVHKSQGSTCSKWKPD